MDNFLEKIQKIHKKNLSTDWSAGDSRSDRIVLPSNPVTSLRSVPGFHKRPQSATIAFQRVAPFFYEDSMKTFTIHALTTILLLGLMTATFAQSMQVDEDRQRAETRAAALRSMQRSPAALQAQKDGLKQMTKSLWYGDGLSFRAMGFLQEEDFRKGIGVSEEQFRKIQEVPQGTMEGPEFQQYRDEMRKLRIGENGTEDMRNRFAELQSQMSARRLEVMIEDMKKALQENLTPEQLKKVQEAQISTMSEMPIISPNVFEALNLSDVQKKQLDEIKKEMEPEFDKHVDKLVDAQMKMMEKMQQDQTIEKMSNITDPEERQKYLQNLMENVRKDNPDAQESGKVFSDALKSKMFDVLTDEQWKRMVDLVDNPPEYLKKVIAEMRKQMGTDNPQARSRQPGGGYIPGPGSWQPGSSAIPEGYRQERNERRRFPSGEN